MEGINYMYLLG